MWRATYLFEKLEHRYKSKHEKTLAQPRKYGSLTNKTAPGGIPSWMISAEDSLSPAGDKEVANETEEELFPEDNSTGEESD